MPLFVNTLFIWPLFIAALIFDVLIGEFPASLHPVVWMGSFIKRGIRFADSKSNRAARFFGGASVVIAGLVIFGISAALMTVWYTTLSTGPVLKIITALLTAYLLKSTFSLSGLLKAAVEVLLSLEAGNLQEARRLTAYHLVSRDTSDLDESEISAAVIESISENLTDSVVAPWSFMLVGGPPAAFSYRFVNTCDSMIGYRNEKYEWLGKFAARLDDVLNFIPARIAAWLLVISAAINRDFSAKGALKTMFREHRLTDSPNAGWTMSSAAGALGVKLEKKGHYTINDGENLPCSGDIGRIVRLIRTAVIISVVIIISLVILASGYFV